MQRQSQSSIPGTIERLFEGYTTLPDTYDEVFAESSAALPATPRLPFARVAQLLDLIGKDEVARAQALAEHALMQQGVTFSVYGDSRGTEKIFPFCLLPRLIAAADWQRLERGLQQRLRALGAFLDDIYGEQHILADNVVPADMVLGAAGYRPSLRGIKPPGGVRIHISGVDLIRDPAGTWRVLEDNLRTPSGVSYVVENRLMSKRMFPRVFDAARVHRVDHYPTRLAETLRSVSQLGVLRAFVSRAYDGPRARASARSGRRGRQGVLPHHARPAPRRRDLSPHRRGVPRSRRVQSR